MSIDTLAEAPFSTMVEALTVGDEIRKRWNSAAAGKTFPVDCMVDCTSRIKQGEVVLHVVTAHGGTLHLWPDEVVARLRKLTADRTLAHELCKFDGNVFPAAAEFHRLRISSPTVKASTIVEKGASARVSMLIRFLLLERRTEPHLCPGL